MVTGVKNFLLEVVGAPLRLYTIHTFHAYVEYLSYSRQDSY